MKEAKITPDAPQRDIELITTDDLIFEIGRLTVELAGAKKLHGLMGNQIKALSAQAGKVQPMQDSINALSEKQEKHIGLIRGLREEIEQLTKEKTALEDDLKEAKKALDFYEADGTALQEEVDTLKRQVASLTSNPVAGKKKKGK